MSSPARNAEKKKEREAQAVQEQQERNEWRLECDMRFGDLLDKLTELGVDPEQLSAYLEFLKSKP